MSNIINSRTVPEAQCKKVTYAVAQCRVSAESQKHKNASLPAQKSRIEKYAIDNNIIILKWEFIEHSGYMELEKDNKFANLIIYAINEPKVTHYLVDEKGVFARNRYDSVVCQEKLRRGNVGLIGVSELDYSTIAQ